MKAIIDTNVLRVASGQHAEASPDCVAQCVQHLLAMKRSGITVIDDGYRILREYLKNPALMKTNTVGGQFLKWLLQNQGNPGRVEQVSLTETAEDCFAEFPDPALEPIFDAPDRKFAAVAHAQGDCISLTPVFVIPSRSPLHSDKTRCKVTRRPQAMI